MIGMSLSDEYIEQVYKMAVEHFDNAVFVELGCFFGASTIFLGQEIKRQKKNITIHAIDRWTDETWDARGPGVEEAFRENIKDAGIEDIVNVIKDDSVNASMAFGGRSVDFVFVDADHDYEAVKKDVLNWMTKLKHGGWIAGHDYQYDVQSVVDMLFKNRVEQYHTCWLVR